MSEMVKCSKCKEPKLATLAFFGPDRRRLKGLQSQCRDCMRLGRNASNCKHREKVNSNAAVYKEKHREKYRLYFQVFNKTTERQQYLKKHREEKHERYSVQHKEWCAANRSKRNAAGAKVRASRKLRIPSWLTEDQYEQIQMFYTAAEALTKEIGIEFEVDHIIPLNGKIVSGLHVPWNLQVITAEENLLKSNKVAV
jgi:hypothetical protein